MNISSLLAISPLDGRYCEKLTELRSITSEFGLIQNRVRVEIEWLITLCKQTDITHLPTLSIQDTATLRAIANDFNQNDAEQVKSIEKTTQHDVKAVEYYLADQLKKHTSLTPYIPWIHFACTSEDINNLAYGLIQKEATALLQHDISNIISILHNLAEQSAETSMLSLTHGQAASPTTLGKELYNVVARLTRELNINQNIHILGKCNGATGNYNAHTIALPTINWPEISSNFVKQLGLTFNPHTTQIEPHDALAEQLDSISRINTILIDLCRDIWGYISRDYFKQTIAKNEIGSSTMPHKVNPIDFENAEGNLGLANALNGHMARKLPVSRYQRDLTDSTVLRNIGVAYGHCQVAYLSLIKGLNKLKTNDNKIQSDLDDHWEILTEAIQTVLRAHGIADAYEQLKHFSRGKAMKREDIKNFIQTLDIPKESKERLLQLTPHSYIGLAKQLTQKS